MQKFEYRSPRFSNDLPVQLTVGHQTINGRCREISIDGMTLELSEPLPAESEGIVSLNYKSHSFKVKVRIVHLEGVHGGLKFLYGSDAERTSVIRLIESLNASPNPHRPVLLK